MLLAGMVLFYLKVRLAGEPEAVKISFKISSLELTSKINFKISSLELIPRRIVI